MVVTMWFHLWNGRTRGRVRPTVLISNVQQRAMASGQPYLKSGVIARLKHALVFGKVPVWAFSLATVLLLLVVRWCRPCEQSNVSGRYFMRSVPALALLSVLAAAICAGESRPLPPLRHGKTASAGLHVHTQQPRCSIEHQAHSTMHRDGLGDHMQAG